MSATIVWAPTQKIAGVISTLRIGPSQFQEDIKRVFGDFGFSNLDVEIGS